MCVAWPCHHRVSVLYHENSKPQWGLYLVRAPGMRKFGVPQQAESPLTSVSLTAWVTWCYHKRRVSLRGFGGLWTTRVFLSFTRSILKHPVLPSVLMSTHDTLRFLSLILGPLTLRPDIHLTTHEREQGLETIYRWAWGRLNMPSPWWSHTPKHRGHSSFLLEEVHSPSFCICRFLY